MDVFVLASQAETRGMVLAEAMSVNVAVITLKASGIREIVTDGVNGRLGVIHVINHLGYLNIILAHEFCG